MPKFSQESARIDSFDFNMQKLSLTFDITVNFSVYNPNFVDISVDRARIMIMYNKAQIGQAQLGYNLFKKREKTSFVIGANITQSDPGTALSMNLAFLGAT